MHQASYQGVGVIGGVFGFGWFSVWRRWRFVGVSLAFRVGIAVAARVGLWRRSVGRPVW